MQLIESFAEKKSFDVACVVWRFWLGVQSNKGGRGQRNREEIGAGVAKIGTCQGKGNVRISGQLKWKRFFFTF